MDSFLPHAFPSPSLPLEFNMYVRPCQHHGRKSSYAFMSTGRSVRAHVTVSYIGHVDVCEPDATDEADEQLPALACSFFSFSVSFSVFLFPFIFFASRRGNGKAWNNFVWLRLGPAMHVTVMRLIFQQQRERFRFPSPLYSRNGYRPVRRVKLPNRAQGIRAM